MNLRVLHVIGGGDTGGAMANVLPLLAALRAEGVQARLLCLGEGGLAERARHRGLAPTVLPMSHAWDARVLPGLWRVLQAGLQDGGGQAGFRRTWHIIHSHGMRANLPVRLLSRVVWPRPCLVTTVHSDLLLDYSNSLQSTLYGRLDQLTWPLVDRLVAVSGELAAGLQARGWPREKTAVVPSGVEFEASDGAGCGEPDAIPERDGRPTIGTVARLVPVKDLDLLLQTAARLRRSFADLRVVIVGDGPEGPRLRAEVVKRGLEGVVHFTGELRPAWPVLETLDAYLLTSKSEGLPVSVLEAMACGLPVVATRVGGLPEAVQEGVNGYLVPREATSEQTAAGLADRLARLLGDEELRRRMGAAGARRAARRFSTKVAAERLLRVYERCLLERAGDRKRRAC